MTRMTDVEYARKVAPEAFAEEDRVAAENAAVEARLVPPPPKAPAAPSRWAMSVPGTFTGTIPSAEESRL